MKTVSVILVFSFAFALSMSCSSKSPPLQEGPANEGEAPAQESVIPEPGKLASDARSKDAGTSATNEPSPSCVAFPTDPSPLIVEGFNEASHLGPTENLSWPAPVTIVLHGNYDRPEWECDTWAYVAGFRGWVLCPRGIPTPWAEPAEDRWTYRGGAVVEREIEASLKALEERYPGCVSREEMALAGFSLGGILAPGLVQSSPGKYDYVFLIEGGSKKLDRRTLKMMKKNGVKGLGLAMSAPGRRSRAKDALPVSRKIGLKAVFVDMKGAGHGYSRDFTETGRAAMEVLTKEDGKDGGVQ